MANARELFNVEIDSFDEIECMLFSNKNIVHCPLFQSAFVKIQGGHIEALSREERAAVTKH